MSRLSCSFFDFDVGRVGVGDEDGILGMVVVRSKKKKKKFQ